MYQAMIFFLIVILFLFGYLSVFNGKEIDLFLSKGTSIHTTASAIVIASFILGMILMAVVSLIREAGRIYGDWQKKNQVNKESLSVSLVDKGNLEVLKGNIEKAKAYYMDAAAKNPTNINAHVKLSECHIMLKNNQDAIKVLLRTKYQDPENIQLLLALYTAYSLTNDINSMTDIAKKLVSIDEESFMFLSLLRDAYIAAGKPEEAYRTHKVIMKLTKGKEDYKAERQRLGGLKYEYALSILKNGDADLALKKLGDVKKLDPDFVPAYVSSGDIYLGSKNDMDGAVDEWKNGYEITHNAVFLIRMEDVYLKHDNPFELIRFYRSLLSVKPDDNLARILFAKLMLRLEMIDDAYEQISYLDNKWVHVPSMDIISAELMAKRGDYPSAYKKLKSIQNNSVQMKFPYVCSKCGHETFSWSAKCPRCGTANGLSIKTSKELETLKTSQPSYPKSSSLSA
jgi:lipopolysaccharide assembly protein B